MVTEKETALKIVQILLETEAVKLDIEKPFLWSSGWKSPIYCDNRITLSFPKERTYIKQKLIQHIQDEYPHVETIAGVATAGIAQGALVADALGLPFLYVRPEPKSHGLKNTIEGKLKENQNVVLIEDLISTGGSSIKAANHLRDNGANVIGLVATFSYAFQVAQQNFEKENIQFSVLSDYTVLLEYALNKGFINNEQLTLLNKWRENPQTWNV